MKNTLGQKQETSSQMIALLAALILSALLASGCSVPPVQGNTIYGDNRDASVSYTNCVNVLTNYGTQTVCNAIGSSNAQSYTTYTTTAGSRAGFAKKDLSTAYSSYLSALDETTQADLSAQFDAAVSQYAH